MKKFTLLMVALLVAAMGFAQVKSLSDVKKGTPSNRLFKKAQMTYTPTRATRDANEATIILSVTDVWGDGTGYQLLIDADNAAYEEDYGPDCGSAYTGWEYMLPANASAADGNVVVNASQQINIPAGTYSYLVLNPGCEDYGVVYIASNHCDGSNETDYVFEAGKIYTFTVNLDETVGNDCVTVTVEDVPAEPIISSLISEFNFSAEINTSSDAQTTVVTAFNLTDVITATVTAPFEVSVDNLTYATTANLPVDGGTLYIRYSPTTIGDSEGTLTLSSTGADDVVATLNGHAFDCSTAHTAPWTEAFAPDSETLECWTIINANQDDRTFSLMYTDAEHTDLLVAYKYSSSNDANDWLVSPKLSIGDNQRIRFDVAAGLASFPEKYKVWAITGTPNNIENATLIIDETEVSNTAMETVTIDMAAYNGQEIFIGIQCVSDADQYYLYIDNFELSSNPATPEIALTSVNPTNNTTVHANEPFSISGVITNHGIALTSYTVSYTVDGGEAVVYNVSDINVASDGTHEFLHTTPVILTTSGEHAIVVTVSNPNGIEDNAADNSITITVNAISCETISEFPYSEGFENGIPSCWTIIDADGDGFNWMTLSDLMGANSAEYSHSGNDAALSLSFDESAGYYGEALESDNWMFTQAIAIPSEGSYIAEWYAANLLPNYPDTYEVYVAASLDVAALANATPAVSHTPGEFEAKRIDLSNYAGQTIYIAFHHEDTDNYGIIIDDFSVFAAPTTADVILTSVAPTSGNVLSGATINISGVVTNNGTALTSYTVSYTVDGGEAVSENINNINVAYGETHNFTFSTAFVLEEVGAHTIIVTVSNPNGVTDADDTNNSKTITMTVVDCNAITEFPYTEDFENGIPACWTKIDVDADGYNWISTEEIITNAGQSTSDIQWAHSGTNAASAWSYYPTGLSTGGWNGISLTSENYLITQAIVLPSDGEYQLSYFVRNLNANYADDFEVKISTTGTDINDFTTLVASEQPSAEYEERTASLSNYAGQTIYIAFVETGDDAFGIILDDITIAVPTAVEENIAEAIAVYPNPANSVITIANAEGQDIVIVNTLGQVVNEINNAAANQTIDISNLANGTYFVKVNAEIVKINVVK